MITSYVDESPTKKVFTFEVPADDVRKATDRTVKALAKQVRLPGFRPGKVPPEMIKRRFAEEVKGEVLEHLIQATVGEALREKHLVPLGQPKIGDLKFAFEEPLSFRVDLEVRPAVEPKDYRGLKVPAGNAVPTDAEIDAFIGRIREGHATYEPIAVLRARGHQGLVPEGRREGLRGLKDDGRGRRRADDAGAFRARAQRRAWSHRDVPEGLGGRRARQGLRGKDRPVHGAPRSAQGARPAGARRRARAPGPDAARRRGCRGSEPRDAAREGCRVAETREGAGGEGGAAPRRPRRPPRSPRSPGARDDGRIGSRFRTQGLRPASDARGRRPEGRAGRLEQPPQGRPALGRAPREGVDR